MTHLSRYRNALLAAVAAIAVSAVTLAPQPATAMSVSPVVVEMSSTGGNSRATLQVVNDSAKPLPVEIQISRVELDANGQQKLTPAGDEFLVFPPQVMVAPGATQVFRLQWVGEPVIPASRSYIFSINQVPVKMAPGKSGVQIVFNFGAVVNVAPPQGQRDLKVVGSGVGRDAKGELRPAVTVTNPGNMHALLSDATVRLSSGAWSKTLTPAELRQSLGVGLVQPGKQRRFLLPVDLPRGVTQVVAQVEYQPKSR